MGVGIFGDQLIETGPDAAHAAAEEAVALLALQEEAPVEEVETSETPEADVEAIAAAEEAARLEDEAREAAEEAGTETEATTEETTEETTTEETVSDDTPKTAGELVEEIDAAETVEEVDALAEGVEFKTVIAAAAKRKEELS